ncbi:MAG: hypothetical protein WD535_03645 [Thermaerobacterales bacterium]
MTERSMVMTEGLWSGADGSTRYVVWVVVEGLTAGSLDIYPEWGSGAGKIEVPNLKSMAQAGTRVISCPGAPVSRSSDALSYLLTGRGQDRLFSLPGSGEKLWLGLFPFQPLAWAAEIPARSPRCMIYSDLVPPSDGGAVDWPQVLAATPRALVADTGGDEDEIRRFIEDRILARFPGESTRARHGGGSEPHSALAWWLEWVGDAFLRSVWFSMTRPAGVTAMLHYPGPALYRQSAGWDGYRRGVEEFDEFLGRLLLLREHEHLDDMLIIVTGDYAASGETAPGGVPVVLQGPQFDDGEVVEACTLTDVVHLVGLYA